MANARSPLLDRVRARAGGYRLRLAHERDLKAFSRRYASVLGAVPQLGDGTALLASLTHSPFQLKLEGMLAKAFQLEGLEPVAAVPFDSVLPRRYLELFGVRSFVTLEEYLTEEQASEAEEAAADALMGIATARELKAFEFRGAGVGRQTLSTVSRALHDGAIDLGQSETRRLAGQLLTLAIRTALASEALLDELAPDLVLFNERNYAAEGPLSDIALERGLNVIQFVSGFEDDTLVFKRYTRETKGLHPRSLSEESWPQVVAQEWSPERQRELDDEFAHRYDGTTFLARWNQGWTKQTTRGEIVARLDLDAAKKTAVVFSHVLWDANMFYGRDLFEDQEEWFVETIRAACENDSVDWVVKLHPANVWKLRRDGYVGELDEHRAIREHIGELPPHVRLLEPDNDISTWSLFDVTDYGITIRGSIGFELPCFGKPVLTAGTGFYSGRGFTIDSSTAEEYLARLRSIQSVKQLDDRQILLARKHAHALFRLRQTHFTSFRALYRSVDEIDAKNPFEATIEVTANDPRALAEADDLRRFGRWAVRSRALDYLET